MAGTTSTLYEREIVYDPETRDFALYLNGQLHGFARTYGDGENELDRVVYKRLQLHGGADELAVSDAA